MRFYKNKNRIFKRERRQLNRGSGGDIRRRELKGSGHVCVVLIGKDSIEGGSLVDPNPDSVSAAIKACQVNVRVTSPVISVVPTL
jgi:hypothetical protein